ncbi:MAG: helix-turn-helix transcriptional regulator [Pseudomonadota bacterium]
MSTYDDRPDPAKRLRLAREKAGFNTAKAAADRFGWVYTSYQAHERGERGIRPDVADEYAKAFGIEASDILFGGGDGEPLSVSPPGREGEKLSSEHFLAIYEKAASTVDGWILEHGDAVSHETRDKLIAREAVRLRQLVQRRLLPAG